MAKEIKISVINIPYKEAVRLLYKGINGDTLPCLMRQDIDGNEWHGIYMEDLDEGSLDDGDRFQLWLD